MSVLAQFERDVLATEPKRDLPPLVPEDVSQSTVILFARL